MTAIKHTPQYETIPLPEYGHHIQHLVDYCKTIKDRKLRTQCAQEIVQIMRIFVIKNKGTAQHIEKKLLWDHLAIMAKHELDIDYPVEITPADILAKPPKPLSYPDRDIIYRHYGHIVQQMIQVACQLPEGTEREQLALLIAHRMKHAYIDFTHRTVDDYTIFKELFELSNGVLELCEEKHSLDITTQPGKETTTRHKPKYQARQRDKAKNKFTQGNHRNNRGRFRPKANQQARKGQRLTNK